MHTLWHAVYGWPAVLRNGGTQRLPCTTQVRYTPMGYSANAAHGGNYRMAASRAVR